MRSDKPRFQPEGGTLQRESIYVKRDADIELIDALDEGEFCYVLDSRQVGKSSLRRQTVDNLRERGIACASLDLSLVGARQDDGGAWYLDLMTELHRALSVPDPKRLWDQNKHLSPSYRWILFLRNNVMNTLSTKVVIFIDEIDLLTLASYRDDFLGAIRYIYNQRADEPVFRNLTFCLIGVVSPKDLVRDVTRSPFNIGRRIRLEDFNELQIRAFLPRLQDISEDAEILLNRIYYWTLGQPFMTHYLCGKLETDNLIIGETPLSRVDRLVQTRFLKRGVEQPTILTHTERIFLDSGRDNRYRQHVGSMLKLYVRLLKQEQVLVDPNSDVHSALLLTGLVSEVQIGNCHYLQVRNRIIESFFNADWATNALAKSGPTKTPLDRVYGAFHGPNAAHVEDLYERYKVDPSLVDETSQILFSSWQAHDDTGESEEQQESAEQLVDVMDITAVARLARFIRSRGHLEVTLDPLGSPSPGSPQLELSSHGLTTKILDSLPASIVGGPLAEKSRNALEALDRLRRVYTGKIGFDFQHIQIDEELAWLSESIEKFSHFALLDSAYKLDILCRLTEVETLERYLSEKFPSRTRFSIEGLDMLVPMLDTILKDHSISGTKEVLIGMSHRGRLNVLAHILGKPYNAILRECKDGYDDSVLMEINEPYAWVASTYDAAGAQYQEGTYDVSPILVHLVPNPRFLELINPIVLGKTRASQEDRSRFGKPRRDLTRSRSIIIHGDASFSGQGIVAETLNLSQLKGYRVGGSIHIILNNQIGHTTYPSDSRSTLYASDLAKGFEVPIAHVNADDPESCIAVATMASWYCLRFGKDFLIDLVGYRRHGHSEQEDPSIHAPRMYEVIRKHPTVRNIWAKELVLQGIVTKELTHSLEVQARNNMEVAFETAQSAGVSYEAPNKGNTNYSGDPIWTSVSEQTILPISGFLTNGTPPDFNMNKSVAALLESRRLNLERHGLIDWGHAEALALATVLADGISVRLSGQDSQRGTLINRHAVLNDPTTGERYTPLVALPQTRATFSVEPISKVRLGSPNLCIGPVSLLA